MPSGLLRGRPGWERRKMSEQRIRLNLWFHRDNEKQSMAHEYIAAAKKAGKSYTEYITDCVLEHEEGERICFRSQSLDVLADMIAQKIREKQGKGMGMGL